MSNHRESLWRDKDARNSWKKKGEDSHNLASISGEKLTDLGGLTVTNSNQNEHLRMFVNIPDLPVIWLEAPVSVVHSVSIMVLSKASFDAHQVVEDDIVRLMKKSPFAVEPGIHDHWR
ncbi:hypothetical protein F0562_006927 [Nyssa sinensis]|uniref:Uncharacterized protein n=1 Tax=Nyssa sinensis TaxID=561372 RepID=A0A5J5A4B6_9ASTE|nr:hypothetical protein F0562_006927 [Nyssa sinensis]